MPSKNMAMKMYVYKLLSIKISMFVRVALAEYVCFMPLIFMLRMPRCH